MDFISVRCMNAGDLKRTPNDISTVRNPIGDESWYQQGEMHTVCITDLVDIGPVRKIGDEREYSIELRYNRVGSQTVRVNFQNAPLAFGARLTIVKAMVANNGATHQFFPAPAPKDRD